jgi:hypothetical protein
MEFDNDKIDDDVLALLYLTASKEKDMPWRAWKGYDWEVMNRLFEKGYISDPKRKAKSVALSDQGYAKAKQLFEAKYAKQG